MKTSAATTPGSSRLPVILQTEMAECGLACVAMIARYHGHDVDLPSLRRRFSTSLNGSNLSSIMNFSARLSFESRPLRVEIEHLPDLKLPCLLHWNLNHFLVLKRVRTKGIEVHDPARGARFIPMSEVRRSLSGIALELRPAADFSPVVERRRLSLRRLTGRIQGVRSAVLQILILALALELLTLVLPLAMQWVLDVVLVSADASLLTMLGLGFTFIVLFQAATLAMRGWLVAGVGASLAAQWTSNLFSHLMRLRLAFFEKRQVGEVISRFSSVLDIKNTLTSSFVEALLDGLTVLLVLVVLCLYSIPLTLLVLATFILYCVLRWIGYRHLLRLNEERLVQVARQQTHLLESLSGAMSVKLGNRQDERSARMSNLCTEVANRDASIQRVASNYSALSRLIFGLQRVALIWIGAWLVLGGYFTAGMMVVVVAYAELFSQRAGTLIDRLIDLRLLALHAERIADIALEPPEPNLYTGYVGPEPEPEIRIDRLGFRYSEHEPWILHDLSCHIRAGENVAIVGPSGCGKTTLAKLIVGLLESEEGKICIGGIDIRRYGLAAYRNLFGCVMQDDSLFAGSLADNIGFFDPAAKMDDIHAAARAAAVHEEILAMPMGYESLVGGIGIALSSGQKQRVLLARALIRRPRLLLLDEATSHLDVDRERTINSRIAALDITRIVIAHRPETIASADRVINLAEGRIGTLQPKQEQLKAAVPLHTSG